MKSGEAPQSMWTFWKPEEGHHSLQAAGPHPEQQWSHIRLLFVDFSSEFISIALPVWTQLDWDRSTNTFRGSWTSEDPGPQKIMKSEDRGPQRIMKSEDHEIRGSWTSEDHEIRGSWLPSSLPGRSVPFLLPQTRTSFNRVHVVLKLPV